MGHSQRRARCTLAALRPPDRLQGHPVTSFEPGREPSATSSFRTFIPLNAGTRRRCNAGRLYGTAR